MVIPLFALLTLQSAAQVKSVTIDWALSGGGTNSDIGFAIAADPGGGAVLVGRMAELATLAGVESQPAGEIDATIAKIDAQGAITWLRRPGGGERDSAQSIATDADGNALVTGFFRGTSRFGNTSSISAGHRDVFVAKYDRAGTLKWIRRAGGTAIDEGRGIAADLNGNVLVTGGFEGEVSFSESTTLKSRGDGDAFIAKYGPNGDLLWVRQIGGDQHAWGNGVDTDSAGNVLVVGVFSELVKFDDGTQFNGRNLASFTAKFDPDGTLLWARVGDSAGRDIVHAVAVDEHDDVLIAGTFSLSIVFEETRLESVGGRDAFLARYRPDGSLVRAQAIGGKGNDSVRAIASDKNGNVLTTGIFERDLEFGNTLLTSAGDQDLFVAAFDANDESIWAQSIGGSEADSGFGIAADGKGSAYVTGSFADTAEVGGVTLTSAGADDLFVVKLHYGDP